MTVAVPLLLVLLGWKLCAPMLNPDSAMGFYVWESHHTGAPWNTYRDVDPANISLDRLVFLTWWSPAQYDLPGLWRALGFSWGHAILLCTLAGIWLQALGCWRLARAVGGSPRASAWFVAVSTLQWHTLFGLGHFRGGDVALFAATPWLLLAAWHVRTRPAWFLALVPVALAGGLYLKLSSMLLTAPLLFAAGLSNAWTLRRRPALLATWGLAALFLAIATWQLAQLFFLSRGPSPASGGAADREIFSPIVFATISPWLAATGAGSLLGRIWFWLGRDVDEIWFHHGWAVLPFAVTAWWVAGRGMIRFLNAPQRAGFLLLVGTSVAMLALLFARGAVIGVDDRYMRPTATALLLALALGIDGASGARPRVSALVLAAVALFGAGSAAQRALALARMHSRGAEDITQQHIPAPALAKFADLNTRGAPRSRVIYVPQANIGIEVLRQRVIAADDLAVHRDHTWRGRVPELVVAVPDVMEADGRGARVRARFLDYRPDEWHAEHEGGWWFWHAGESPALRRS